MTSLTGASIRAHAGDFIPWLKTLPPDVAEKIVKLFSPYHYLVSKPISMAILLLFSASTAGHLAYAARFRTWWMLPTAFFCGIIEILGWSGRLWSASSPLRWIPFQIQICGTIIAPTPLLAANFVIFGQVIERLGPQFSRLSPKWYTILFCTCDVISLVVQEVGGGIAATATNNLSKANRGANIMLGGIIFQLIVIVAFSILALEYFFRFVHKSPVQANWGSRTGGTFTTKLKIMIGAMFFVTLVLFIRAVYRTIELSEGWTGRIISTEVYFNVLDGAMVILAIYTYNIINPGIFLNERLPNSSLNYGHQINLNVTEKSEAKSSRFA